MSDNQITPQYEQNQKKTFKTNIDLPTKKHKASKIKHPPQASRLNPSYPNTNPISYQSHKAISFSILQQHSITPAAYSHHIVSNLIDSANNHFIAIFKDHMIMDYIDEFLKRTYKAKESFERIPKFANYYKNYLLFFCKPIFSDLKINELIQQYGEATAKVYYNQNYGKQKKKQKAHISDKLKIIFSLTVKEGINQNSSLEISKTVNDESMSLTESDLFCVNNYNNNNKNKFNHVSYYQESLISLLNELQPKKINGQKMRNEIPLPFTTHQGLKISEQKKKKNLPFTERTDISKDRHNEKESYEELRTLETNVNTGNHHHHLSRNFNINHNHNNSNSNNAKTINSRNKPIKLTTCQPLHMKTVSVQFQGNQKDKYIKTTGKMIFQTKTSSDLRIGTNNANSNKTLTQSKKTLGTQRTFSNNINPSGTGSSNLNDVMKLTLQLYYPSTKRNTKNNNNHQTPNHNQQSSHQAQISSHPSQHQHTLSSPTINNFNININNHISLNETKSPKIIRNHNSNYNNNYSDSHSNINFNLNPNANGTEINPNKKKQQHTIVDELKKNINLNFDLKNIMKRNKALSRNKPQSLTKTKTLEAKAQNNLISRHSINLNQNKQFTSFSIFDLQQQLLNSKVIRQINSKHTLCNNKKSNENPSSNQQQSLSQTKLFKSKNLQTVKSQPIQNKTSRNGKGSVNQTRKHINHQGEGGGLSTQTNFGIIK